MLEVACRELAQADPSSDIHPMATGRNADGVTDKVSRFFMLRYNESGRRPFAVTNLFAVIALLVKRRLLWVRQVSPDMTLLEKVCRLKRARCCMGRRFDGQIPL